MRRILARLLLCATTFGTATSVVSPQTGGDSRPTTQPTGAIDWKDRLAAAATPEDADAVVLDAGKRPSPESVAFLNRLALDFPKRKVASTALAVLARIPDFDFVRLVETIRRVQSRPEDRRRIAEFLIDAPPHRAAALDYFADAIAKDAVVEERMFMIDCIDKILAQASPAGDRTALTDRLLATYTEQVDSDLGRKVFSVTRRLTIDERLPFDLAALDRSEKDDRIAAAVDLLRERIDDAERFVVATLFRDGDRAARRLFLEGLVDHVTPVFFLRFLESAEGAALADTADFSRILARADLKRVEPLVRARLEQGVGNARTAAVILMGENALAPGPLAERQLMASNDAALTIAFFAYGSFLPDDRADWRTLLSRLDTRTDLETVDVVDLLRELGIVNTRTWTWIEDALDVGADTFCRAAIYRTAAALGYPKIGEILSDSIDSPQWQLRLAIAEALAAWSDHAAAPLLIELVDDDHSRIAHIAVDALRLRYGRDCGAAKAEWKAALAGIPSRGPIPVSAPTSRPATQERYGPRFYGLDLRSNKVVFVCDCSGSMQGPKIERLKRELADVVRSIEHPGAFNVILFSDVARAIWTSIQPATKDKKASVAKLIDSIHANGGTNAYAGLSDALKDMNADTIVFLSDGQPSVGSITEPNAILDAVEKINRKKRMTIHAIWVEQTIDASTATTTGPGSEFLRDLARRNGGQFLFVGP